MVGSPVSSSSVGSTSIRRMSFSSGADSLSGISILRVVKRARDAPMGIPCSNTEMDLQGVVALFYEIVGAERLRLPPCSKLAGARDGPSYVERPDFVLTKSARRTQRLPHR